MKRLLGLLLVGSFLVLPLLVVPPAYAQFDPFETICVGETADDSAACNTDGNSDPLSGSGGLIMKAVMILSYATGAAAVIMVILGGLKFITANGDANSVSSARNTVLYALIGIVVFAASQLIVRFVISSL